MRSFQLTPTKLRIILIVALLLLIAAHALVTALGRKILAENSTSVTEAVTLSASSQNTLDRLSNAEVQLKSQSKIVEKAKKVVADGNQHAYQESVINDINNYAKAAGIHVTGFTFENPVAKDASGKSAKTETTKNSQQIQGVKTTTVILTLQSPMDYSTFLKFLRMLEENLLQLRLQSLNLSSSAISTTGTTEGQPEPGQTIDVPTITLEVYTKNE